MWRFFVTPLALLLSGGSVHAVVLPDDVQASLNQRYDAFVGVAGFTKVAPSELQKGWYTPSRFPDRATDSIVRPDAGINAATKALMLLESQEPSLPHARYRVTYRLDNAPDFSGYANAYVEVTRFNLGPARRADVANSTPVGVPMAPAEYFGVGPNVSWRFVMGWHQGGVADVVRASRRTLSLVQAKAMDCLGVPCPALENPQGPTGEWQQVTPPPVKPAAYLGEVNGIATAARVSEMLYRHASAGQDQIEALATHAEKPQLSFVISMNVDGQDYSADGLLHQQLLLDDAISDIWTRRRDAGSGTVEWQQYVEHHPGRN